MSGYDFKSLSASEFEALVHDLLENHLGIHLEIFKTGRDKGIDLRYSRSSRGSTIVQCKHYATAGLRILLSDLKKEVSKVIQLKPKRYLIVTSVPLSPDNKDVIFGLFSPYCKGTGDIIGGNELNAMLRTNREVEKTHYKLWLTSTTVIESIVKARILNATQAELNHIRSKIKLYVQNDSFRRALEILAKDHYCIIAGIPGIGKTTLAEALMMHHLGDNYKIIKVSENIGEAHELFRTTDRQVVYYDDFLGQTKIGEKLGKNEDASLLRFIDIVRQSKYGRLILTTREYILNDAKAGYEKLDRSDFDLRKCVVRVEDYTKLIRAQILYNHLYFSGISQDHVNAIIDNTRYLKIINHPNYNPRLIDSMTDSSRINSIPPSMYFKSFIDTLNYPIALWEHPFVNQLSDASRHLLIVLMSLPPRVDIGHVKRAFDSFHALQSAKYNTQTTSRDFMQSLRQLEGTFTITDELPTKMRVISFHNPSVRDYIEQEVIWNDGLVADLCASIVFFEQCILLWEITKADNQRTTRLVSNSVHEFEDALHRTYQENACYYEIPPQDATLGERAFRRQRTLSASTVEDRVKFIAHVVTILVSSSGKEMISDMARVIEKRVEEQKSSRQPLMELLRDKNMRTLVEHFPSGEILYSAQSIILNEPEEFEDFEVITEFMDSFPRLVSDEELENVRLSFYSWVDNFIDDAECSNDPVNIRSWTDSISHIGHLLHADITPDLLRLDKLASEIDRKVREQYEDNDEDDDLRSVGQDMRIVENEDEKIREMFSTLALRKG